MTTVPCVGFILFKDNKILVERRKKEKKVYPFCITLPGGKIDENETSEQAIIREVKEEFDVTVKKFKYIGHKKEIINNILFPIDYFLVTEWTGEIKCLEADELFWIKPEEYKMIASSVDKEIIKEHFFLTRL
jgi:8-oxo-dGTP diphosphatase